MDELPQGAQGRMIMTTEPKFVPKDQVEVELGEKTKAKIRLVDCVGFPDSGSRRSYGKRTAADGKDALVRGGDSL